MFFDFLMKPFQYIIRIIQKIIKGLMGDIDAFRTLLKPIRLFILNATQKFYDTLNNFMEPALEDPNLANAASAMKVDIDAETLTVKVFVGDRGVKSIFNGEKGCYLDKIN